MTTRTAERIDEWESRPFDGGYAGLQDLADAEFSGVVTVGQATACLLNGTVVGVLDGTIEDFEDGSGTIRTAPSQALPLLMVMQERADEVRAKYYSEETPLSQADQKLSDGGFTGYVELSENVLSGDYFVVYHGGRSMSVAYVGQSDQLLTDDEAFQRADDEVGIYKVYPVDIDPIEIPEPDEPAEAAGSADPDDDTDAVAGDDAAAVDETDEREPAEDTREPRDGPDTPDTESAGETSSGRERDATARNDPDAARAREEDTASRRGRESAASADAAGEPEQSSGEEVTGGLARQDRSGADDQRADDRTDAESRETDRSRQRDPDRRNRERDERRDRGRNERRDQERDETRNRNAPRQSQTSDREERDAVETAPNRGGGEAGGVPREESTGGSAGTDPLADTPDPTEASGDLETRSIPSVDPDRTWTGDEDGPSGGIDTPAGMEIESGNQFEGIDRPAGSNSEPSASGPRTSGGRTSGGHTSGRSGGRESSELASELREKEETIESLEAELADLEAERDQLLTETEDLEAELKRVREERDDLQAEVERLQSRVADLEAAADSDGGAGDSGVEADVQLTPAEAIEETNLFVRYHSKGNATLEAAHDGEADKDAVEENLDLEYHTSFDAASAAVGDQSFEAFLTGTIQYRFVEWVVHDLLYEIRDTGHADALRDLFDALPRLDRAELNGSVSLTYTEDGEEHRTQESFDVVLRDRMGHPIAVANINDSREAATDEMMTSLVTESTRAGESHETLAGAFFVTASFFDPDALETASESTGGGLLSRDKRESYVRLGRKQGYHLCLVEARDSKFHLAVPEL